jgi:hypothetical protein
MKQGRQAEGAIEKALHIENNSHAKNHSNCRMELRGKSSFRRLKRRYQHRQKTQTGLERPIFWTLKRVSQAAFTSGRRKLRRRSGMALNIGTRERIFYGEFDGRRRKRVLVKVIGE